MSSELRHGEYSFAWSDWKKAQILLYFNNVFFLRDKEILEIKIEKM